MRQEVGEGTDTQGLAGLVKTWAFPLGKNGEPPEVMNIGV